MRLSIIIIGAALAAALSGTLLLTTPAGADVLSAALDAAGGARPRYGFGRAQAIAVLGGRPERVRTAALLHRQTGLPVLVTGKGTGAYSFAAESQHMAQLLRDEYRIRPRWVETESLDTTENARFSWCLIAPLGIRRVVLVTDAGHMLRARLEFLAAGFEVLPAPTADEVPPDRHWNLRDLLPSRAGLQAVQGPLKEWAGAAAVLVEAAFPGGVRDARSPGHARPRSCIPQPGTAATDRDAHRVGATAAGP